MPAAMCISPKATHVVTHITQDHSRQGCFFNTDLFKFTPKESQTRTWVLPELTSQVASSFALEPSAMTHESWTKLAILSHDQLEDHKLKLEIKDFDLLGNLR